MQIIVTRVLDRKYKWITKLNDRVEREDLREMMAEVDLLEDEQDLLNAESVFDLMTKLNQNKEWVKEMIGMGAFRDLFKEEFEKKDKEIQDLSIQLQNKDEQLQSKDEQLQSKDKQLKNQSEQLKTEKEENTKLRKEIEELKKQLGKIAVL